MKNSPVITLTTDFGDRDGFTGVMKGVILGINPDAKIVDITGEIERHNIDQAAFVIKNSYSFFPEGTIHIVIVDPGVGSSRKAIILYSMGHIFIATDNGVLRYIFSESKQQKVYNIINKEYFLEPVSSTFHGRDIFAPVAAHISLGIDLEKFGPQVFDYIKGKALEPKKTKNEITGKVIYCDRFGNIITNIKKSDLPENFYKNDVSINIKGYNIEEISESYSEGDRTSPFAVFGSSGYLEIAIYLGSAAEALAVKISNPVVLSIN